MKLDLILLVALLFSGLWTVLTARLIRSVVGLALTSAILSIIMFRLHSPMAAVFELSVCAGLISVIFVTTVSFTQRLNKDKLRIRKRERFARFWFLPILLIAGWLMLSRVTVPIYIHKFPVLIHPDVRFVLWNLRHADLLGQIIVIICGVFAVVILFKEPKK